MVEKSRQEPSFAPPKLADFAFDLDRVARSIVSVQATIPDDAFTAPILGSSRSGSGVVIPGDGLVLTIGYLITEAESVWLASADGRVVAGHALAYDQESGFGLIQALDRLDLPALELGRSNAAKPGDPVILAGGGGRKNSVLARIVGVDEFAGYWEYLLDDAIFTAPAHPLWGGAGLIGQDGKLLGVGSLHAQHAIRGGAQQDVNMVVPIDLLPPILDDLLRHGRANRPARPWLGLYCIDNKDRIVVAGLSDRGPAAEAGLRQGDAVLAVDGERINSLAAFYRGLWKCGPAGAEIPVEVERDGRRFRLRIKSIDRASLLRKPRLH